MANGCLIDDAYFVAMGEYFKRQGERIDVMIEDYVSILNRVRDTGIIKGDVHKVLEAYIEYASKMKGNVGEISRNAQAQTAKFLNRVDEADQYLF